MKNNLLGRLTLKKNETENYKFNQHKTCEYFPCHKGVDATQFNCLLTSKLLGISRSTLYRKIDRFNLKRARFNR